MTVYTETFRKAHSELSEQTEAIRLAAARLPELTLEERNETLDELLEFLHGEVEPHTRYDERYLYPEVAARLGAPLATASMNYDHVAIRQWIAALEITDRSDVTKLQELLYGLDAIIRVHIWKENELYLPAVGSATWPAA
jgi:hypothetical protein